MARLTVDEIEDGITCDFDESEAKFLETDFLDEQAANVNNVMERAVPHWALPLLRPCRYKFVKGGRGSGKSHEMAEALVEACVLDPNLSAVCIREVQKSMRFSSKRLVENKIRSMGVSRLFRVLETHIERINGNGIILFQGMQDHTADSIKSLEGFRLAWIEEAASISARSLQLLIPTIRSDNPDSDDEAEIWASWNPDQDTDAIEQLAAKLAADPDAIIIHVNYDENPHLPVTLYKEVQRFIRTDPEAFDHVYKGGYNTKSRAQIFAGKWCVDEFEPQAHWDGPYHGLDFGFSEDPMACVRMWIGEWGGGEALYIEREAYSAQLGIDAHYEFINKRIPDIAHYEVRCDNARPDSIDYLERHGMPFAVPCSKGKGSVEDGIEFIKSFAKIVIHTRCTNMIDEAKLYKHKVDAKSGQVLPTIVDKFNHLWDAVRYGLEPVMKNNQADRRFAAMGAD